MIKDIWTAVMLFSGSIMDVRKKSVPVLFLVMAAAGSTLMSILDQCDTKEKLLGLLPGERCWR